MASAPIDSATPEPHTQVPALQVLYDTAPIGLAFLTTDCRYRQINRRLTEICGASVADHLGRSVRETLPALADQIEALVKTVLETGVPVTGVELRGQRPDEAHRVWVTGWHPLRDADGKPLGVNVVAEEITERKQIEAALVASETRFRELADNISQFAWTADAQGRIYWFNKRWHDYAGTTLEEMQGSGWQKVHHPAHADRVLRRIRQSFENGTPWEDTFPLRSKDGTYRWFLSRALPIRNEAGEVVRWFGTHTDVSEQIEAEMGLRHLNETLEQRVESEAQERARIWDVSQDLLVVTDIEGKFLAVNPAWTTTLGWSAEDLLGKTSEWLLHPDDREKARTERSHLAQGRKRSRFRGRFRHKLGSYRRLSWTAAPDRGRIYAVGRDVTELQRAEEALRELRRELARASRQTTMGAMTASIAHEINQPLSAIVTNGEVGLRWLTRAQPDLDEVRGALRRIVDDGLRASEVIRSIRAMFGKDRREKTPVNVDDVIREVLALTHSELESQQVTLQTELRNAHVEVMGDRIQLQQVFLNLIMNAIEAMAPVRDRARVLVMTTGSGESDETRITVRDSGTGIDPNDGDKIFRPFFTTKSHGIGMGLAICRSIIEGHGGRLWVSPGDTHGAVFHINLPNAASGG